MSTKKNPKSTAPNTRPIKIGTRVRCTDDGVEGRIVWANAGSVKIRWDDGEEVTWKRDALAHKPIEVLDQAGGVQDATPPSPLAAAGQGPEPAPVGQVVAPASATVAEEPPASAAAPEPQHEAEATAPPDPVNDSFPPEASVADHAPAQPQEAGTNGSGEAQPAPAPGRRGKAKKGAGTPKQKKTSALDAAVKVLAEGGRPMSCAEMIGMMAAKGYWSSPAGKTPAATLYSAILRELQVKGERSRFLKSDRGRFALRPTP